MQPPVSQCKSCGAPIFWLNHATTGKPAPIDVAPTTAGNILISGNTYGVVVKPANVMIPEALHTNHFQTCPDKADWTTKAKAPHALS